MARTATASDLLRELAFAGGVARPAALRGALGGISAQTLGRLVDAAGEDVHRIGQTRSVQYVRTRSVEGLGRAVPAFRVDEAGQVRQAGTMRFVWGGGTVWEQDGGQGQLFRGLPPVLVDMAPQGFVGRNFSERFPELHLPPRITDWSDDHRLISLARRGEDCVGDVIIGDESLSRFLAQLPEDVGPEQYPDRAERSATEVVGSSAGGERPKFGVYSRGRHVLVKFARDAESDVARRWRDLLWCEWMALETIAAAGRAVPHGRCFDAGGWRFLEVERFDRVGRQGRRPVLSLFALNNEYLGAPNTWTSAAPLLRERPFSLPQSDAVEMRWRDVFGQLIGNTDRHFGNVSFFVGTGGTLRLAPAYDMVPMILAPSADIVVTRRFEPEPPTGSTLDVWSDAANWALRFWREVRDHEDLGSDLRAYADQASNAISQVAARVAPLQTSSAAS